MTYLEAVNAVLQRLRESTVASVSQTTYSSLVGAFVNDAKRFVEDKWQWSAQLTPVSVSIVTSSSGPYNLASSLNERAQIYIRPDNGYIVARCTTSGFQAQALALTNFADSYESRQTYTNVFPDSFFLDNQNSAATSGQSHLRLSTVSPSDGNYTFQILFNNKQNALTADGTVITAPSDPIVQLAYLYCLYERGEEMGEFLTLTEGKANDALGAAIALDTTGTNQDLIFNVQ